MLLKWWVADDNNSNNNNNNNTNGSGNVYGAVIMVKPLRVHLVQVAR